MSSQRPSTPTPRGRQRSKSPAHQPSVADRAVSKVAGKKVLEGL